MPKQTDVWDSTTGPNLYVVACLRFHIVKNGICIFHYIIYFRFLILFFRRYHFYHSDWY